MVKRTQNSSLLQRVHIKVRKQLVMAQFACDRKVASSSGGRNDFTRAATNDYLDNWLICRLLFRLIGGVKNNLISLYFTIIIRNYP